MRFWIATFFGLLFAVGAAAQNRVELGYQTTKRGVTWYRNGLPTHKPQWRLSQDTNAVMWVDTFTALRYDWDYKLDVWRTKGFSTAALPPKETVTSGAATVDNRTAFWRSPSNEILHYYSHTDTAWVPFDALIYLSAAPANIAAGGSNAAAKYTTSLWQDRDDQKLYKWNGTAWEEITSSAGDASATNEGILGVGAGGANTALVTSNTSGAAGVTISGSNTILVTESTSANGGTITIQGDTSLLATVNDVNAARNRDDSTWVKIDGSYLNKRITSNIWRGGTTLLQGLGGSATDTSGLFILSQGAAATKPGIWWAGNQSFLYEGQADSRGDSISDFGMYRLWADYGAPVGDNQVLLWGFNTTPGGGRKNTSRAGASFRLEEKYNNAGWPVPGPFYEVHLPDIQHKNGLTSVRPLTGYFGHNQSQGGYWQMNSDFLFFQDYANTPKGWFSFKTSAQYPKGLTFLDTASVVFYQNNVSEIIFGNTSNSPQIKALKSNASNEVELAYSGSTGLKIGTTSIKVPNSTAIFVDGSGDLAVGNTANRTRLTIDAASEGVLRLKNNLETVGWTHYIDADEWILQNPSGNAIVNVNEAAPSFSLFIKSDGDVGLGTNNPTAREHIFTSSGATKALLKAENSTGVNALYRSNATPEGAITANPGDIATTSISSLGDFWVKKVGTGNTGWEYAQTATKVTKAVPTTTDATQEIGVITHNEGGRSAFVGVDVVVAASGFAVQKKYIIPLVFSSTGGAWQTLLPIASSGANGGNNFNVEIKSNTSGSPSGGIDTLRIRRTAGSTAANALVTIEFFSTGTGNTFTSTSATSTSAVTATYAYNAVSNVANKSGVNVIDPVRTFHVAGEVRITDLTTDAPTRLVGADADGDLNEVTLAGGLTITGTTITMPSGTSNQTLRHNGTVWVASSEIINDDASVGIGGSPVSGFELYVNGAQRNDGALVSRATGSNFTASLATPHLRLWNTTATTGDTWYLGSEDDGDFSITSSNLGAIQVLIENTTGDVGIGNAAPTQKLHVTGSARVTGAFYDSNNDPGTSGQVLSSTVTGTDWIAASGGGTLTAANNGLYVSGTTVRMGTNPLIEATLIDQNANDMRFFDGKWSFTDQSTSWTPTQGMGVEGAEASPTTNTSPTKDGIIEFRVSNAGTAQPNSLVIGGYATDADGIWVQARSHSNPSFEYPLSAQPRGGQFSVGRLTGLDAQVTLTAVGLSGSTVSGSVLHWESSEGNLKAAATFGVGTDIADGEIAYFDAADIVRVTNRNTTTGTSSLRFAVGGETSDRMTVLAATVTPNARVGIGTTAPNSTLHSAGSFASAFITTTTATTLDERHNKIAYTGSANVTFTLPAASSFAGREYIVAHNGSGGTLTFSTTITKGNASTFNTLTAGQWAWFSSDGTIWRGFKIASL